MKREREKWRQEERKKRKERESFNMLKGRMRERGLARHQYQVHCRRRREAKTNRKIATHRQIELL